MGWNLLGEIYSVKFKIKNWKGSKKICFIYWDKKYESEMKKNSLKTLRIFKGNQEYFAKKIKVPQKNLAKNYLKKLFRGISHTILFS